MEMHMRVWQNVCTKMYRLGKERIVHMTDIIVYVLENIIVI